MVRRKTFVLVRKAFILTRNSLEVSGRGQSCGIYTGAIVQRGGATSSQTEYSRQEAGPRKRGSPTFGCVLTQQLLGIRDKDWPKRLKLWLDSGGKCVQGLRARRYFCIRCSAWGPTVQVSFGQRAGHESGFPGDWSRAFVDRAIALHIPGTFPAANHCLIATIGDAWAIQALIHSSAHCTKMAAGGLYL